jgi:hypothetical protein
LADCICILGKKASLKRLLSGRITAVRLLKTAKAPLSAATPATANSNRFDFELEFDDDSSELGTDTCGSCPKDNCIKEDETAILFTSASNFEEAKDGSGRQRILIAAIKDPKPFFASSLAAI